MSEPEVATFHLRVPRAERSYVHWILEAHEGLATLTEPAGVDEELVVTVPLAQRDDLVRILEALAAEVPLVLRAAPAPSPRHGARAGVRGSNPPVT